MPIFYLDSCAITKLVAEEAESEDLVATLTEEPSLWMCSDLARVEVMRSVARNYPDLLPEASCELRNLAMLSLDSAIYDLASRLQPTRLRSLDAIHVAAALSLGRDLTAVVTYDKRLVEAAQLNGLTVLSPGVN